MLNASNANNALFMAVAARQSLDSHSPKSRDNVGGDDDSFASGAEAGAPSAAFREVPYRRASWSRSGRSNSLEQHQIQSSLRDFKEAIERRSSSMGPGAGPGGQQQLEMTRRSLMRAMELDLDLDEGGSGAVGRGGAGGGSAAEAAAAAAGLAELWDQEVLTGRSALPSVAALEAVGVRSSPRKPRSLHPLPLLPSPKEEDQPSSGELLPSPAAAAASTFFRASRVSFLDADGGDDSGGGGGEDGGPPSCSSSVVMEPSSFSSSSGGVKRRSRRASFLSGEHTSLVTFFGRDVLSSWDHDFTTSSVDEMVRCCCCCCHCYRCCCMVGPPPTTQAHSLTHYYLFTLLRFHTITCSHYYLFTLLFGGREDGGSHRPLPPFWCRFFPTTPHFPYLPSIPFLFPSLPPLRTSCVTTCLS